MRTPEDTTLVLSRAIERVTKAKIKNAEKWIQFLQRAADIPGVESVCQRIIERDDETALDHLIEVMYGVLFKDLRFRPRFEPTGPKGPDLLVKREGLAAFVEVKHYRQKEGEDIPQSFGPDGTLLEYGGDPLRTQIRIETDLLDKVRQVVPRTGVEHGILALWSDREYIEDVEFQCAVRSIAPEAAKKGLRLCVFGSGYVHLSGNQRFYFEPVSLIGTFQHWRDDIQTAP